MQSVRSQFPIFEQVDTEDEPFIFLDNASTTQKPHCVINAITDFYSGYYSNVGRGLYQQANQTTKAYEQAREKVRKFVGSKTANEVVFTSGTTDSINKVASAYLLPKLSSGDVVLVSEMDHHSNYVPWQQACIKAKAEFRVIPLHNDFSLNISEFEKLLSNKVKMVAIPAINNVLGVKNDLPKLIQLARQYNTKVLVDAAQLPLSETINVQHMDCDFLAFSGHKLFGPTGIGVLYGKQELLEEMQPMSYGGGMVKQVGFNETGFMDLPSKHEAGTPNTAGAIGLAAAIDFVESIGVNEIAQHSFGLRNYAIQQLSEIEDIQLYGADLKDSAILAFNLEQVHPHDVATFLAEKGIAVRAGHHCAQPLLKWMKVQSLVRVSFSIYNSKDEVDLLKRALLDIKDFFS